MRFAITLLLLSWTLAVSATTFIVTTNADSGPGSLRDAITQAAANGTGTADFINFNITDQTRAGRTITLTSTLPDLTSNLTIDGTTQPGIPFGISAARIILTNPSATALNYYFQMIGATNIGIYGLFMQSAFSIWGFYFHACTNLSFGAPGKGNILQGFKTAILCAIQPPTDPPTRDVSILSNIMGADESGTTTNPSQINDNNIDLANIYNLQVGGLGPNEGNLMNQLNYPFEYKDTYKDDFGYLNFQGNKVGVDITGNMELSNSFLSLDIIGYITGVPNRAGNNPLLVNITGNVTSGGYQLYGLSSPFVIQGNHIGVGLDNVTKINNGAFGITYDFTIQSCAKGMIGGPNPGDKNYIANNDLALYEFFCGPITVSQNSFFCNLVGIQTDQPTPTVNITSLTTGMVGGTTVPNGKVELFYDDACPGCEGKTYIATTTADASGNWNYALTPTGTIVATVTDPTGATSPFSTATLNSSNVVINNATCGQINGSIKNMEVASGTDWYWKDAAGNIVATTKDLENAPPGTYTFTASIGGAACEAVSRPFTITNVDFPPFDFTDLQKQNDTCNTATGSIQFLNTQNPNTTYTWNWYNTLDLNTPIATTAGTLTNIKAGTYIAIVTNQYDCPTKSQPQTVENISIPPTPPIAEDQTIPKNSSATIQVTNPQKGTYTLLDDGGATLDRSQTGTLHTPNLARDATFDISFTRGDCTSSLATIHIKVFDTFQIFIPNAFTPNGDGNNDRWHPVIKGLTKKFQISIFDRWGVQVLNSSDPNIYWDGNLKGNKLSGVFVYMISGTDYYNKPFRFNGTITIIR